MSPESDEIQGNEMDMEMMTDSEKSNLQNLIDANQELAVLLDLDEKTELALWEVTGLDTKLKQSTPFDNFDVFMGVIDSNYRDAIIEQNAIGAYFPTIKRGSLFPKSGYVDVIALMVNKGHAELAYDFAKVLTGANRDEAVAQRLSDVFAPFFRPPAAPGKAEQKNSDIYPVDEAVAQRLSDVFAPFFRPPVAPGKAEQKNSDIYPVTEARQRFTDFIQSTLLMVEALGILYGDNPTHFNKVAIPKVLGIRESAGIGQVDPVGKSWNDRVRKVLLDDMVHSAYHRTNVYLAAREDTREVGVQVISKISEADAGMNNLTYNFIPESQLVLQKDLTEYLPESERVKFQDDSIPLVDRILQQENTANHLVTFKSVGI